MTATMRDLEAQRSGAAAPLVVERLSVRYGHAVVLDDVHLQVPAGEVVAVVGPSGCGKSTLLRVLAGLLPADAGRVLADGAAVTAASADRAMVFQEDGLLPWRTVLGNVELPLAVQGVGRKDRRESARSWLTRVGLAGHEHHLPRQLSGGMRQRVQLARALAGAPRAVLMDEPFGALDAQTRATMQRLLIDVWQAQPTTVLFVTHDVDEALLIADRVAVMSAGPGRIRTTIDVPRPRDDDARHDPGTVARRQQILEELGQRSEPSREAE
jgi:NitT/TauT family transport system ATP-binding protein